MDYLKIGQANDLEGRDRLLYRILEMLPGFLSWGTLLGLTIFSFFQPVLVAFFIIAFDVYWLLLVVFLGIHLLASYRKMKKSTKIDWQGKCESIKPEDITVTGINAWQELVHLVIFPISHESLDVIKPSVEAIAEGLYPTEKMIFCLAIEERGGPELKKRAEHMQAQYGDKFYRFLIAEHPDGIVGELKGKGANQAWAARQIKSEIIDHDKIDYSKIMVSVFDIDTIIYPQYFFCLTYTFLTVDNPYKASYQPIPVYHNNIWQAPFFARVAAGSNTFWQMMQQIRQEKLATYSSHSMPWQALVDIGFWSTTMVSEDSRIFWHCFCHYRGNYRVEPLNYPVSMDVTMDKSMKQTAKSLYMQQRRWGWGVENVPYLIFNTIKNWKMYPKTKMVNRILVQLYGFHSWATNALIIGVIGWMPMLLGGDRFNVTVLSSNLPFVTRTLMMAAMSGLILSALLSSLLLPPRPKELPRSKTLWMLVQWIVLPVTIIIFGAIPGLEAQTRLMLNKRLGFFVTPKSR